MTYRPCNRQQTRGTRLLLPVSVAVLVLPGSAGAAVAAKVTLNGGITPAYDLAVLDYVTTCRANRVDVSVTAPAGGRARIDLRAFRAGTQTAHLAVKPGQRIRVTVTKGRSTATHVIRCLPQDFPAFTATGQLPAGSPFMTFAQLRPLPRAYIVVVNSRGTPVWWLKTGINSDVKPIGTGQIGSWSGGPIDASAQAGVGHFIVYSLRGTVIHRVTSGTDVQDNHETLPTANGEWYTTNYDRRDHVDLSAFGLSADSSLYDGRISRISKTGKAVWNWSSKDHIALAETGVWWNVIREPWKVFGGLVRDVPADLVHVNSIAEDANGGLIVSFRHLATGQCLSLLPR